MPTFCRHGRLLQNCTICSKREAPKRSPRTPRPARARSSAPSTRAATRMRVSRVQRAADDGYDNELVAGLHATADAARLAGDIAFSAARLDELRTAPPDPYARAVAAGPDAAAARLFEIACRGERGTREPDGAIAAYDAWAQRNGGHLAALTADASWTPERRFARLEERLRLPGVGRGTRFEFLVSLGALGVVPVTAGQLFLGREVDSVAGAAKRVFGIGDAINLERRARDLADAIGVPLACLDLALHNWSLPEDERATMGSDAGPDAVVAELAAAVLRIGDSSTTAE